jgi:hypothetical protein
MVHSNAVSEWYGGGDNDYLYAESTAIRPITDTVHYRYK